MAKVDIESDLPKVEKRVDSLVKGVKKIGSMHKKKYGEFETVNGALWEGKDQIEDDQKKLKKEKDTKKIKALAEEIEEMEKTFKKMTAKIGPITKALDDMGTTAGNLKRSLDEEKKELEAMQKALKRTGGDVKQIKAWDKDIKDLLSAVEKSADEAAFVKDAGYAKTPKL